MEKMMSVSPLTPSIAWFPGLTLKRILCTYLANYLEELGKRANLDTTIKVSCYLQQLPVTLLEELLLEFVDTGSKLLASHAAFVLHPQMKRLVLDDDLIWRGHKFDVPFFLDAAGDRMRGLIHLKLPIGTAIRAADVQRLCQLAPNLQILDLYCVKMKDEVMPYIATLKLKQLDLSFVPITGAGIHELCCPRSKIRFTLKKLSIWATDIEKADCYQILAIMPQLEELSSDFSIYSLFDELPEYLQRETFGLRILTQNTGIGDIINYLKVSTIETIVRSCPLMEKVSLSLNVPDVSMANCLKKFHQLTDLKLELRKLADERFTFHDFVPFLQSVCDHLTILGLFLPYELDIHPLLFDVKFHSIYKLVVCDHETRHMTSDLLISLLVACPEVEELKLISVVHLCSETAIRVVNNGALTNLKRVTLIDCKNIGVLGISSWINLPSLTDALVKDCVWEEDEDAIWDEKPDRVTLNFWRNNAY